jgi:hypothetical protein
MKRSKETTTFNDSTIAALKLKRDEAWRLFKEKCEVLNTYEEKWEETEKAYVEAVMYERAKRAVMADLIKAAGKISEK